MGLANGMHDDKYGGSVPGRRAPKRRTEADGLSLEEDGEGIYGCLDIRAMMEERGYSQTLWNT